MFQRFLDLSPAIPLQSGIRLWEMAEASYGIVGLAKLSKRDWWEETTIRDLRLICVPAQHFSGRAQGKAQ